MFNASRTPKNTDYFGTFLEAYTAYLERGKASVAARNILTSLVRHGAQPMVNLMKLSEVHYKDFFEAITELNELGLVSTEESSPEEVVQLTPTGSSLADSMQYADADNDR
jgi:predicted transcriptional regulator